MSAAAWSSTASSRAAQQRKKGDPREGIAFFYEAAFAAGRSQLVLRILKKPLAVLRGMRIVVVEPAAVKACEP